MTATPGSIVLQPLSLDLKSAAIALHYAMQVERPLYAHCGILMSVQPNGDPKQMLTASGGPVAYQDAGATGNIVVPYAWNDWPNVQQWLDGQIGKPYDWTAWLYAAIEPVASRLGFNPKTSATRYGISAFTCSSLVGAAMAIDGNPNPILALRTVTPDDIADAIGG